MGWKNTELLQNMYHWKKNQTNIRLPESLYMMETVKAERIKGSKEVLKVEMVCCCLKKQKRCVFQMFGKVKIRLRNNKGLKQSLCFSQHTYWS